jgi:hypothetical protein
VAEESLETPCFERTLASLVGVAGSAYEQTSDVCHASFDDPNLVSHASLVPVMPLAEHAGVAS